MNITFFLDSADRSKPEFDNFYLWVFAKVCSKITRLPSLFLFYFQAFLHYLWLMNAYQVIWEVQLRSFVQLWCIIVYVLNLSRDWMRVTVSIIVDSQIVNLLLLKETNQVSLNNLEREWRWRFKSKWRDLRSAWY